MANKKDMVSKLPAIFQTVTQRKFFDATFDQVFSAKNSERTTGYLGRRIAGEFDPVSDYYLPEPNKSRTWYQLEPTAVSSDSDTLQKTNRFFYTDLVDRLRHLGADVSNHDRLFGSKYYSFAPPIDVDKFVNYRDYYWVPEELPAIDVKAVYSDIVPNTEYTASSGLVFTNGIRIRLKNDDNEIYTVEGVGTAIQLVPDPFTRLSVPTYAHLPWDGSVPVNNITKDNTRWDELPWDAIEASTYGHDYVVIGRGALNNNAWSRTNRWFHIETIRTMLANVSGSVFPPNSTNASRPIIEFAKDTELYKSGTTFIGEVDTKAEFGENPTLGDIYIVTGGLYPDQGGHKGLSFYWDGEEWAQTYNTKVGKTQAPLFSLYDDTGTLLDDADKYPASNFSGSELFSYQLDDDPDAVVDTILGLPIVYTSLGQSSDIMFENDLHVNAYSYIDNDTVFDISGYKYFKDTMTGNFANEWNASAIDSKQHVIDRFVVFDTDKDLFVLSVNAIYFNATVNGKDVVTEVVDNGSGNTVLRIADLEENDVVEVTTYTHSLLDNNDRGYFEIPQQLEANPDNDDVSSHSFGALLPHFDSIVGSQESDTYRDSAQDLSLGNVIVQNDASLLTTMLISGNDDLDVVNAIRFAQTEYVNSVSKLTKIANQMQNRSYGLVVNSSEMQVSAWLNEIMNVMTISKEFSDSFAYSYMFSRGDVYDVYSTSDTLVIENEHYDSVKHSIYVYDTDETQLFVDIDYEIQNTDNNIVITLFNNQDVTINYYKDSTPAYLPASPAKLGLAPVFIPSIEMDNTFVVPRMVIVGHDGTRTPVYGDYIDDIETGSIPNQRFMTESGDDIDLRDLLRFELEKRIYNDIDAKFRNSTPNMPIEEIRPGYFRSEEQNRYSREEYFKITESFFSRWTAENKADFRVNEFYESQAEAWKTWNYSSQQYDGEYLPGHWKGIFLCYYDTIRPDTHPWEMLGHSTKPADWDDRFESSDDMWAYIETGGGNKYYARPGLNAILPVNAQNVIRPVSNIFGLDPAGQWSGVSDPWVYGDGAPVETAWYESAEYKFSEIEMCYLMRPSEFGIKMWDPLSYTDLGNEFGNQRIGDNGKRPQNNDKQVHAELIDDVIVYKTGVQQYISDRLLFLGKNISDTFGQKVRNLTVNLGHKMAAFTDEDTIKIRLTSSSADSTTGNYIVPTSNYDVSLHTSSSVADYVYSGVMVRVLASGAFKVYGYDLLDQSFMMLPARASSRRITVRQGGTPAPYRDFKFGDAYTAGEYVLYRSRYYQANVTHTANDFTSTKWTRLGALPEVGGIQVSYYPERESTADRIPYSTTMTSVQEVYDFLIGYGAYLESKGWAYGEVDSVGNAKNWKASAETFLGWAVSNWEPDNVIILSPSADKIVLDVDRGYPMSVEQMSNGVYSIMNKYGIAIDPADTLITRNEQEIIVEPADRNVSICYLRVSAAETEHVLMFDNVTEFNDTLYSPLLRVRQDRLKFTGTRTNDWYGKMEAGGYLIQDSGLIQNFENLTSSITEYYNTETALDEPMVDLATKHLVGFENKDYLDELEISDDVQFNFYQGYIRQKGTANSVSKLLRSDAIQDKQDITMYEEWALKLQDFGGTAENITLEFVSKYNEITSNPQVFRLNTTLAETGIVDRIEIFNADVLYATAPTITIDAPTSGEQATAIATLGADKKLAQINIIKPGSGYETAPNVTIADGGSDMVYAVLKLDVAHDDPSDTIVDIDINNSDRWILKPSDTITMSMTDVIDYQMPNAGYVHKDDVDFLAFDVDAVSALWSKSVVPVNDNLIWVAKNTQEDWGVYEVTEQNATIANVNDEAIVRTTFINTADPLADNKTYLGSKHNESGLVSGILLIDGVVYNITHVSGNDYKVDDVKYEDAFPEGATEFSTFVNQRGITWIDDNGSGKWQVGSREQEDLIDTSLFDNAYLRDPTANSTNAMLPVYDPFKGIIPGVADQNISYKTARDPARYTHASEARLVNENRLFHSDKVGLLWWDLSNVRYMYYEQGTVEYRRENWGALFPGSSIDVYEWVESPRPPAQYSGTGTPRNQTDYVKRERYNSTLNANVVTYYFWVSGKIENDINRNNRTLSCAEVSALLSDTQSSKHEYFAPIHSADTNISFVVSESGRVLTGTNAIVQVNYKTRKDANKTHAQWQLVKEGDRFSIISDMHWDRMVDSLVGYTDVIPDAGLNKYGIPVEGGVVLPVPDPDLHTGERYGIGIRPQQSMFADIHAARQIMYQAANTSLATMRLWSTLFTGWDAELTPSKYWEYTDWYAVGYHSRNTVAKRQVETIDQLYDLVGVLNHDELVKVYPAQPSSTDRVRIYTYDAQNDTFELVRRELGTVGLTASIYTDTSSRDLHTSIRELLTAMKTNLFIAEYKAFENNFYFSMLNYVFSEQQNVDWAFKTTYVTFLQDNIELTQKPKYETDVLNEFVEYVNDVKPYSTKIRDVVSVLSPVNDDVYGSAYDEHEFNIGMTYSDDVNIEPTDTLVMKTEYEAIQLDAEEKWDEDPWDSSLWDEEFDDDDLIPVAFITHVDQDAPVYTRIDNAASTTLVGVLTKDSTTVNVTDSSELPASGIVWIGAEKITYSGKSGNELTISERGVDRTIHVSHANGAKVVSGIDDQVFVETDLDIARDDFANLFDDDGNSTTDYWFAERGNLLAGQVIENDDPLLDKHEKTKYLVNATEQSEFLLEKPGTIE